MVWLGMREACQAGRGWRRRGWCSGYPDATALELDDYVALATPHRDEIDGAVEFDAALLDEAPGVSAKLRALPPVDENKAARKALYDRRNKIINVLYKRVNMVRSAARAAFRHHPEIAQGATSTYARKVRAESRRARAKKAEPTTSGTATPPA